MNVVYKLHGLPATIVSDRDLTFTSKIWQGLFKLSDTSLKLSSSYQPQTDGQTEWVNRVFCALLFDEMKGLVGYR
jgi:hypothetical protein